MTKVFAMLVTKDEESRYLQPFIEHHDSIFDGVFVYDDQSSDSTVEMVREAGWNVVVRPDDQPSFMEHEGEFRYASWLAFEKTMRPIRGDWVFAIDADEFLVGRSSEIRPAINLCIRNAAKRRRMAVQIPRPEVWKVDEDIAYTRMDGFWNKIICSRLFIYKPKGLWNMKPMGCGSEPTYVNGPLFADHNELVLLHFGYARDQDKQDKYQRYSSLKQHGHNNAHIESILKKPILEAWNGSIPSFPNGIFDG